jgi:hypothetical protein
MLLAPAMFPDRAAWEAAVDTEFGIFELTTVAYCLIAVVFAAMALRRRRVMPGPMGVFIVLGLLAALYLGGEECSWGQTYFQWETPEIWVEKNRQEETNLHNVSGFFNELPRNIMTGAALVGGVILPLVFKRRLENDDAPESIWYWLLPNYRLVPLAAMAVFITMPEHLKLFERGTYWGYALHEPAGEVKEFAFAGVMMLYFMSMYYRATSLAAGQRPA